VRKKLKLKIFEQKFYVILHNLNCEELMKFAKKVSWYISEAFLEAEGALVPHSQCSLRENPEILQNFSSENNTLKEKI
jgi:hypothetical protein